MSNNQNCLIINAQIPNIVLFGLANSDKLGYNGTYIISIVYLMPIHMILKTLKFEVYIMRYLKLLLGLPVLLLTACSGLPERVDSDDIPHWCQEEQKDTSILPFLIPGVGTVLQIADALSDETFYACGIATGTEIGATRAAALQNAKDQIKSKLIGTALSKIKPSELIRNYQNHIHSDAFGYKTVEFKSFDIQSGYTVFLLIETRGRDLVGTIQALRTRESIKRDEARRKEQRHHGRDMFE